MSAPKHFALTANRLTDGRVVLLKTNGSWQDGTDQVLIAQDPKDFDAAAAQGESAQIVVGAYPFEVQTPSPDQVRAIKFREQIRLDGPTIQAGPSSKETRG